jgi:hypothetical protein
LQILKIFGKLSLKDWELHHASCQKLVVFPFPTFILLQARCWGKNSLITVKPLTTIYHVVGLFGTRLLTQVCPSRYFTSQNNLLNFCFPISWPTVARKMI